MKNKNINIRRINTLLIAILMVLMAFSSVSFSVSADETFDTMSLWTTNSDIISGLPDIGSNGKPTIFQMDDIYYLICGENSGKFYGFQWTGSQWISNSSIISGLVDPGWESKPTVFQMDGTWYLILGESGANIYGYRWSGSSWVSYPTIKSGLSVTELSAHISHLNIGDTHYIILGQNRYGFRGYHWSGSSWVSNSTIRSGLSTTIYWARGCAFEMLGTWYHISMDSDTGKWGHHWSGSSWVSNSTVISGLSYTSNDNYQATHFLMDGSYYLIFGRADGKFIGYKGPDGPQTPCTLENEIPADNSEDVSGLLTEWSVYVNSTVNTSGTIECSNGDMTTWDDEEAGRKTLTFTGYLDYNTTYTVWVNVTVEGGEVKETFTFKTTTCKLAGTVSDDFWGGVSDVKVVANSTSVEYTTYTDNDGHYEFDDVIYGADVNYNITASKFAYTFYGNSPEYRIENMERNVSDADFRAVHFFFKGDGTIGDPFTIRNCTHLDNIRLYPNYTFVLNNDIDMSECNVQNWNGGKGFEPICNETTPFTGTFDGGAYIISNLYIDYPDMDYVGLFGYVENSDIQNLGLEQINITGGNYTGSLAGYIDNTSVLMCFTYSNNSLIGDNYTGGLIGLFNDSSIQDSYARVETTGNNYVGGLIGQTTSESLVNKTYATGTVIGNAADGGLIGDNGNDDSTIINSFYDNETSGQGDINKGVGKNTSDMTSLDFWDTTEFSFPDIWFLDENQNDIYPILSIFTEITPPLLREVNHAGSLTQQIYRYLNSSFNPEDYCFFNVTAFVPSERYMGRWNKNVSDSYFIATGDMTDEPDYNDTQNNYVVASRFVSDYTGYYEQIRVFTVWHGMYPAHLGAAVYTDVDGEPGELLGYTEAYTIPEGRDEVWFPDTSHVWLELELTNPVLMAKDTSYWLVATSNDSSMWRESKYGEYNLSTYSDFSWLLGRADGESTDNVKRLAYNVTLNVPNKEYVDPYGDPDYAYWKGDVQNATFDWASSFVGQPWEQGVDSMTTVLNESAEPVSLTELLIYAVTTVDVSPVDITKVEMTWGTDDGSISWDAPVEMSRVSPDMDYWEYNKTNLDGGDWNTWMITLYDEFGNIESYDYYRWLKHGSTERIYFQVNASTPGVDYKEITNETDLYSQDWVFYLYEAYYDDTPEIYGDNEGRKQVLRHEQGVDGSAYDTGYWLAEEPTDEYHERTCAFFVGGVWDTSVVIPDDVTIENAVMVWWTSSGRQITGPYWAPPYDDVGTNLHWGRADTEASFDEFYIDDLGFGEWEAYMYDALGDTIAWQEFPETRRYLNDWINFEEDTWYYPDTPLFDNSTGRISNYMGRQIVGKADFTALAGTDYPNTFDSNSIYQLFLGLDYDAMWSSGPNAAIFNNRSHPSFVIFNVPDDETLKATDSNNDGINDYEALYLYGLHPFWNDTDNDGFTDIQELSRDTGANLYKDFPTDSNIIHIKDMTPLKDNSTDEWGTILSVTVENPNAQDMDIKWYVLRNFTFNSSYINQDQLLDGDWELLQTNASVSDGTYTMTYVPASGDNHWAVNVSDGTWWGNRSSTFSGPNRQINGTVTEFGSGLEGVKVTAVSGTGDTYYNYTNSEGYYLLENMTGGNYTITPTYQDYFFIPYTTLWLSTENLTADFQVINATQHSNEYPYNISWDVNNAVTWSVLIDYEYAFDWSIECSDGNSSSSTDDTSGRKNLSLSDLEYSTEYTIWVNSSNSEHSHVETKDIYYFTVKDEKTAYPGQPVDFTATIYSDTQIDLTWTKGADADYTYIRYDEDTPPANREDGLFLYNDTGTSTSAIDLDSGFSYGFSAWSYNVTYDSWSYMVIDDAIADMPTIVFNEPTEDEGLIGTVIPVDIDLVYGDNFTYNISLCKGDDVIDWFENGTGTDVNVYVDWNITEYEPGLYTIKIVNNIATVVISYDITLKYHLMTDISLSEDIPVSHHQTDEWECYIDYALGPTFNWTIETNPDAGSSSGNDEAPGYKSVTLSNLLSSTQYTVYVNATGSGTNETFTFNTTGEHVELQINNSLDNSHYYDVKKGDMVYLHAFVHPHGLDIDTIETWEVTFTHGLLVYPQDDIEWGNLFDDDTFREFIEGVDNTSGTLTGLVWGSATSTNESGILYYLNFTTDDVGWAYVNLTDSEIGVAYDMEDVNFSYVSGVQLYIHFYEPSAPINFTASKYVPLEINLTWERDIVSTGPGDGIADTTYIERNTISSWNRTEGLEIYNNTGESYTDTVPDSKVQYYYQAWSYNATDNLYSSPASDNITSMNYPPEQPMLVSPADDTPYHSVYSVYLNVTVVDMDNDTMDVHFYWDSDVLIGTLSDIENNTQASLYLPDFITPDWLDRDTTYGWYAVANDTTSNPDEGFTNQSDTWSFTTSRYTDINEDGIINFLDVSLLVTNYRTTCTSGQYGWDIIRDGKINYLDVSALVSDYMWQHALYPF